MKIDYCVSDHGRGGFSARANVKRFNDLSGAWRAAESKARRTLARCGIEGAKLARANWGYSIVDASGRYLTGAAVIRADCY